MRCSIIVVLGLGLGGCFEDAPSGGSGGTSGDTDTTTSAGSTSTSSGSETDSATTSDTASTGAETDGMTGGTTDPTGGGTTGEPDCGDGVVDSPEECDGVNLNGWSCDLLGFDGGDLYCNPNCTLGTDQCTGSGCGDGVIQDGEVCDSPDFGGEDCATYGYSGGQLGCSADCSEIDVSGCLREDTCENGAFEQGELCMQSVANWDSNGSQGDITLADLNGDGLPDVAGGNEVKLIVLENEGGGGYAATEQSPGGIGQVGSGSGFGEANGVSLLVTFPAPGELGVMQWQGGGLQLAGSSSIGVDPTGLVAVDMDDDGAQDVAWAVWGSLSWAKGNGGPNLNDQGNITANPLYDVVLADYDGNGELDIVGGGVGELVFYRRMPNMIDFDGTCGIGNDNIELAVGDLTGNGLDEVLALSSDGVEVIDLTDAPNCIVLQTLPVASDSTDVALGDFDGVGGLDVVVVDGQSSDAWFHFNDGTGVLLQPVTLAVGESSFAVDAGDLDQDGVSDVAFMGPDRLQVFHANP